MAGLSERPEEPEAQEAHEGRHYCWGAALGQQEGLAHVSQNGQHKP